MNYLTYIRYYTHIWKHQVSVTWICLHVWRVKFYSMQTNYSNHELFDLRLHLYPYLHIPGKCHFLGNYWRVKIFLIWIIWSHYHIQGKCDLNLFSYYLLASQIILNLNNLIFVWSVVKYTHKVVSQEDAFARIGEIYWRWEIQLLHCWILWIEMFWIQFKEQTSTWSRQSTYSGCEYFHY